MSDFLQFELTLPIAPEAELVAAGTTEQIALHTGFDEKAMAEVRLAVIEACINAFEHSDSPDKRVYLTFVAEEDKLLVIVRDFGKGFDPTQAERPRIKEKLKTLQPRGWGLTLIKRFMDKVEFHDIAPGTELRMTKYLNSPNTPGASPPPTPCPPVS
jgi:serine/threonine-protein kinase RsbW